MPSIPDFQADHTAHDAHSALRKSLAVAEHAQHCDLLWFSEIMRRGLFRELGFSSIQAYADQELGFSIGKTRDFVRLAGKLEELPRLKESVEQGKVGYTKVREVVKVATPQTELLPTAKVDTELAREVPVRVSLEMSPEQFARYEALWEKLHKLGGAPNKSEALLEATAGRVAELEAGTSSAATQGKQSNNATPALRGARVERTPSFQIHIHKCPDCERATVQTSAGEKPISHAEQERSECDAVITRPGHRARTTIPPKTRREVLARDRHRCQAPGCTHTRFLEIHHKRAVSKGGGNEPSNLITLCSACHRLVHERPLNRAVVFVRR